jgi:hypothetical protein
MFCDLLENRGAGLDDLARQNVRINDNGTMLLPPTRDSGFA